VGKVKEGVSYQQKSEVVKLENETWLFFISLPMVRGKE
jgi:hypothetical protein